MNAAHFMHSDSYLVCRSVICFIQLTTRFVWPYPVIHQSACFITPANTIGNQCVQIKEGPVYVVIGCMIVWQEKHQDKLK